MKSLFRTLSFIALLFCVSMYSSQDAWGQTQQEATTAKSSSESKRQTAVTDQNAALVDHAKYVKQYNDIAAKYNSVKENMTEADRTSFLADMGKAKTELDSAKTKIDAAKTDFQNGDTAALAAGLQYVQSNWAAATTGYTNSANKFGKASGNSKDASTNCTTSNSFQFDALVTLSKYIKSDDKKKDEPCTVTIEGEPETPPQPCMSCTSDCLELLPLDDEIGMFETSALG